MLCAGEANIRAQDEIIAFWFGDALGDITRVEARQALWFGTDETTDREIRERFGPRVEAATGGELDTWTHTPRGQLALILLLDQFRRNIFRGTPDAFAADDRALAVAQHGIARGDDSHLSPLERVFLYMPFQHAESLPVQAQSVALFDALAASVPDNARKTFEGFAKYARMHRDIVARFGRFPHRNRVLGRETTAEEAAYLAGDAPDFGQ